MNRNSQAGFTLVEVLIAIVILVFGLVAVTNLFLIAGTSSMAANAGTATAAIASQEMERLKSLRYDNVLLNAGGGLDPTAPVANYNLMAVQVPGAAGAIDVVWQVTQVQAQLKHIELIAQARGPLMGPRTQARFTTFRACTAPVPVPYDVAICPVGAAAGAPCCPRTQVGLCCPAIP